MGGTWLKTFMNFDNIMNAMSSQFVMSNGIGWREIMYNAARANDIDHIPNAKIIDAPFTIFYFIISLIIGNFFIMNLFVGFIIAPYNR